MIFSSSAYGFCILLAVIIELPSRSQTTFALAPTLKGRRIDIQGRADIEGACSTFLRLILTRVVRFKTFSFDWGLRGTSPRAELQIRAAVIALAGAPFIKSNFKNVLRS